MAVVKGRRSIIINLVISKTIKNMNRNVEIIENIENLLKELKSSLGGDSLKRSKITKPKTDKTKFSGLTGEIYKLVQEDFFKTPNRREISEIVKKLHQRTINKPATSLMKPLRLLIRKGVLDREKVGGKGNYKYFEAK